MHLLEFRLFVLDSGQRVQRPVPALVRRSTARHLGGAVLVKRLVEELNGSEGAVGARKDLGGPRLTVPRRPTSGHTRAQMKGSDLGFRAAGSKIWPL